MGKTITFVLTPKGTVNENRREWMSSNEFSPDNPDFKEGKDYMMMTYEERSLDLDTVEAQPGHVVTGVRLRKLGGHLNLEVRVSHLHGGNFIFLKNKQS